MSPRIALLVAIASVCPAQDFSRDVQPIFERRCQGCHGAAQQMGGFRLDSPASASRITGKIIDRITSTKPGFFMPPVGERLTDAEVAKIRAWIEAGAKWPANNDRPAHWAFQPVKHPGVPQVHQRNWARNTIDKFILARLEAQKTAPSPETDRHTLIRRVSLDF